MAGAMGCPFGVAGACSAEWQSSIALSHAAAHRLGRAAAPRPLRCDGSKSLCGALDCLDIRLCHGGTVVERTLSELRTREIWPADAVKWHRCVLGLQLHLASDFIAVKVLSQPQSGLDAR